MRMFLLAIFIWAISQSSNLRADDQQPIELTIHGKAIESPPLKYRLLPTEPELKPGNAVPILLRLPWEETPYINNVYPKLQDQEWESLPLASPQWEKFPGLLPDKFYNEMRRAAFRRDAFWEYPIGEQPAYFILLPDVQGLRVLLGVGLSAKARYHISRGELDQAQECFLVGLANGRHLAQTPFYINQLVAAAIQRRILDGIAEFVAQPKSPNLYWALSTLPGSLIELERAASLEAGAFAMTFPAVNDLDRPRDAMEWKKMAEQFHNLLQELGEVPKSASNLADLRRPEFMKLVREELPRLTGVAEEKVAAMSDDEAGVRWFIHYRTNRDHHMAAVLSLPPREAFPRMKEAQTEIESFAKKIGFKASDPINLTSVYVTAWSLKRKVDALRVVEAVRHYVATHDGKLPAKLDDIVDLPVPLDPLTNQPFGWKIDSGTAVLKAPDLPADLMESGDVRRSSFLEYRLRVQ